LQILTPAPTPWFTTDFPIVEGTKLLDLEAIAPKGEIQIQQTFPIRGSYNLLLDVQPLTAGEFAPFQQKITLTLPENSIKYRNFAILMLVLIAVGLVGGWMIGGKQKVQAGEIAPQPVRLVLSGLVVVAIAALLYVNVSAEIAQSKMTMPMSHMSHMSHTSAMNMNHDSTPIAIQSQGLKLEIAGDQQAIVGNPANLKVRLVEAKTGQPVKDVMFLVKASQSEKNWVAFAANLPAAEGQQTWQQQFFDGSPHKVEIEVSPQPKASRQFQPFKVSQEIEVEGVAPPLTVRLITLVYFTMVVAIGFAIGFLVKQRWVRKRSPAMSN
jgi:hypothetical protein